MLDKSTTHPTAHKRIKSPASRGPSTQWLKKETKRSDDDDDDDALDDFLTNTSLLGAFSSNFSTLGYTEPTGSIELNPVVGVATVELTQPSGDNYVIKYDDMSADDTKANHPEVGTAVVRTLRSKSLEEEVRCFVAEDALGSNGSAPFGSNCLGGSCGCALTVSNRSKRRPGGRRRWRTYTGDLPPIWESEASHVDAVGVVEIVGSDSAEPEIAPSDLRGDRDDAVAAASDPVIANLPPDGYRYIEVEIESEFPGDLEKAVAFGKFSRDPETQNEINAGSGDIDARESPDLWGDVPAWLSQSDSAWRDSDWRQNDILPPKADLNILLAGKLIDEGDLAGDLFGLGGEERLGYRLVECVFDTGAFHSVTPRGIFPGPITSSPMSRAGKKYRGPDSSRIPNLGQLDGRWLDELGAPCGLP